jgi:hypothetical protein
MSPNDENEQLSTRSDKFELGKGTPSELCRVSNLSDFGALLSFEMPPVKVLDINELRSIFI